MIGNGFALFFCPKITFQDHFIIKSYCPVHIKYSSSIVLESSCTFIKMPKFKLKHHDNLQIISLYRQGWSVNAIVKKLDQKGIDVNINKGSSDTNILIQFIYPPLRQSWTLTLIMLNQLLQKTRQIHLPI